MASTLIGSKNHSVVAFDLTFKADKTVSLLHAVAAPVVAGIVEDAQTASVAAALRYLEDAAVFSRRGRNGVEQVQVDEFRWRVVGEQVS